MTADARPTWVRDLLRAPRSHPLRDLDRVPTVGVDLPDGWGGVCEQLADAGGLTVRTGDDVADPTAFATRAAGPQGGPHRDSDPRDRLAALVRGAASSSKRLDGSDLVLTLGSLTDAGDVPAWSAAAGGSNLGRAPLLLVPVLLERGGTRDVWQVHLDPTRPTWANLVAARAIADDHPAVAAVLMSAPVVPVTHLVALLERVAAAVAADRAAASDAGAPDPTATSAASATPDRPDAHPLDLLITADLALLPLGPLHAAAAARTSPWCAPAAPPAPPPADAEEPGARGTLLAPAPADTAARPAPAPADAAARPAPDAPVVEVLTARAGPGGDGVVAELVTEALAAGRRVAVIAPVDEDLVPFATRLAAGGLTPFALDLTGPCATRDGLRAHLSASGRPTAPPVVAAAGVARERSDLLAQLAADTALADVLGPAGLSLWQAWTEASRLEAELPPEAVVAAREIDLPSDVARSPAARSALLEAATQVGEAMAVTVEQDRWPADGLDRWSPQVAHAVSSATGLLLAAEPALTGPLRTLAGSAATVTELTALARWLRATALTAPVPLGDAVERCDAAWQERARALRLDLEQLDRMHREDLAGLRPSVLDLDPAPLLAELDAEPERGWLGRVTGRSPETRQEAKVARRLAAHRAPLRRTAQGDLRGQLAALERARALADDVRTLATTLLDDPAPWNPLAEDDRDLVLQLVETWEATAGIAHVPGVAADVLDAVVPAAGATRREPGRRAGQDPAGAVIALADGATALASALGVDADDEEWLAGRAVLATLDQERAGWSADLADGLPALRRRVLLRTGLAALRAVGAPDLVAVVGAAEQDGAPDHPRRGLPPVRPEHLAGVAGLAVLHRVLDERRRAAEAAPARLSTAARAVLVDRAADLERAHRGAARDVIPHRLLGHVPGGPEGRAELADQLTAGLEHSPLRPFLAEHGDGVGALLPVQLVPTELLPWSLPVLPDGGLLVVDRADQVPAASIAAAAARAGHVVLVDRTEGQPHDVSSALGALGPGAPAAGDARDRRPEVRALPTEPSWERHRAVVTAASLIAGLTVSEPGGPDGRVADLAVASAGGPAVALLLAQPGPASQSAAGTGRATPLPDGASPPEVALTAWLARGGARSPDAGGAWTAVRSISLTAWVVDRGEVIDEVVRAARGHGSGQAGPVRLG